jgi:toxin ParE1/3/4
MSWTIERSHKARFDLLEIWDYIAADNPAAADRQIDKIETFFDLLADFPKIGRERNDIVAGARGFTKGRYLILYRLEEARQIVQIVRVIDGMRDLQSLFS